MASEAELLRRIEALEDELRREREQAGSASTILDQMMRQMPAFYWLVDRELRFVSSGGAIESISGVPQGAFRGLTIQQVVAAGGLDADAVTNHQRALAGETVKLEADYRGKLLATAIGPYRLGDEIVGAIGTSIDVTTSRLLERRMIDAQRAESLGVLAGGLAHDFNNLLVAVIGNADIALRELADGKLGRHVLEDIRTAGLRAAELTEQLLAYAGRVGAGTMRIHPSELLDELTRMLAPSIPKSVQIVIDVPSKLAVRGDPAQLRQVLLNLIANARDALLGRDGTIRIHARPEQVTGGAHAQDILTPSAGSYVVIEVADNGAGMDADTRRQVFERFFTTKQSGHGLGLAAVLGIVRAHGGGIRLISSPGAGATFQVLWPAAATATMHVTPRATPAGPIVLVIDDEDLVRDVLARMIEDLGDLSMPQMSGADVVSALRARRPDLPIVVCSGYDRDGKGLAGADAYLAKPFRIDVLERTLAKLLPLQSV